MIPLRDYRPSGSFPLVTVALIAVNLLVYLYQALILGSQRALVDVGFRFQMISLEQLFVFKYGVSPCEILGSCEPFPDATFPIWLTLFTSMFLHGGLLHLIGNMWYLWIFGDNVEDAMGRLRFLLFYLLSGIASAFAQVMANPDSAIPMVGASGAIAGVLGAYLLLYPYGRVLTLMIFFYFIRMVEVPAIVLLGFWFFLQLANASLGQLTGGGVAWFAHIGGFLAGAVLLFFFKKRHVSIGFFKRGYYD